MDSAILFIIATAIALLIYNVVILSIKTEKLSERLDILEEKMEVKMNAGKE